MNDALITQLKAQLEQAKAARDNAAAQANFAAGQADTLEKVIAALLTPTAEATAAP